MGGTDDGNIGSLNTGLSYGASVVDSVDDSIGCFSTVGESDPGLDAVDLERGLAAQFLCEELEDEPLDGVPAVHSTPVVLQIRVASARIAGRLRERTAAWREMGADPEILSWVAEGYRIPFSCDRALVPVFRAAGNPGGTFGPPPPALSKTR